MLFFWYASVCLVGNFKGKRKKALPVICQRSGYDNSRYCLLSPGKPLGSIPGSGPAPVPNCRQLPKAAAASGHAAILAPGTAAGSLRAPRRTLQSRPAPRGSGRPGSSRAPAPRTGCCLQSPWPQVSSRRDREALPSLFRRRASHRAPRPRRGAAGRAGGARGGGGRGRAVGGPEGEEQERGLGATFSKQRCHTRRPLRFRGLWRGSRTAGRPGGRAAAGDHTGEPPPAPSPAPRRELPPASLTRTPGSSWWLPSNPTLFYRETRGLPPPSLPLRPQPWLRGAVALSRAHWRLQPTPPPNPFTEHPL